MSDIEITPNLLRAVSEWAKSKVSVGNAGNMERFVSGYLRGAAEALDEETKSSQEGETRERFLCIAGFDDRISVTTNVGAQTQVPRGIVAVDAGHGIELWFTNEVSMSTPTGDDVPALVVTKAGEVISAEWAASERDGGKLWQYDDETAHCIEFEEVERWRFRP